MTSFTNGLGARDRLRYFATIVLTVAAALASVATSDPAAYISADPVSGRIELSPDTPEIRIPFTFSLSDEAAQGNAHLDIGLSPTWIDATPAIVDRGLDVTLETPAGTTRDYNYCPNGCVGSNVLVVRWPLEAENGRVQVAWTLKPHVEFEGTDTAPDGATVTFTADSPPSIPEPLLRTGMTLGNPLGMAVAQYEIAAEGPVPSLVLSIPGGASDSSPFLIAADGGWVAVGPGQAYAGLLDGCDSYPCEVSVLAVAMAQGSGQAVQEISAAEASPQINIDPVQLEPWQTPVAVHHQQLTLSEGSSVTLPVSVLLPFDVAGMPTVVQIETAITTVEATERADFWIYHPSTGFHGGRGWVDESKSFDQVAQAVAPACDASGCRAEFDITSALRPTYGTEDLAGATIEIDLRVSFLFPTVQQGLPDLILEVGAAQ